MRQSLYQKAVRERKAGNVSLTDEIEWLRILLQCRNNVKKRIAPLLRKLNEPQPELGTGAGGDEIKQIDLAAESAIIDTLQKHGIQFTLISEESGLRKFGISSSEHFVTVDPIDGTTNLTRGIPFYASSIAISTGSMLNTVHAALVTDLCHDVAYVAQRGTGAYRDKERIHPSKNVSLERAVIGLDINTIGIQKLIPRLATLAQRTRHLRHLGANALELCYVADGTTDAFVDIRGKLRTTDMAAAWLIIREAGAKMTTVDGKPLDVRLDPKQTVAFVASGNRRIHETVLGLIGSETEAR